MYWCDGGDRRDRWLRRVRYGARLGCERRASSARPGSAWDAAPLGDSLPRGRESEGSFGVHQRLDVFPADDDGLDLDVIHRVFVRLGMLRDLRDGRGPRQTQGLGLDRRRSRHGGRTLRCSADVVGWRQRRRRSARSVRRNVRGNRWRSVRRSRGRWWPLRRLPRGVGSCGVKRRRQSRRRLGPVALVRLALCAAARGTQDLELHLETRSLGLQDVRCRLHHLQPTLEVVDGLVLGGDGLDQREDGGLRVLGLPQPERVQQQLEGRRGHSCGQGSTKWVRASLVQPRAARKARRVVGYGRS